MFVLRAWWGRRVSHVSVFFFLGALLAHQVKEQAEAEDETDEWMSKGKAYPAMPGLFWHLDKEMSKKAKVGEHPPGLNYTDFYG